MEKVSRKKKLGGYPAAGVVLSIFFALFVLGLFGTILIYSRGFEKLVRDNLSVKIYLKSNVSETQRSQLQRSLEGEKFISTSENAIRFVSKEEAEKDLISEIGDYKEVLGENPLKDAFIVKINEAHQDTTHLKAIKTKLEKNKAVVEVNYESPVIEAVNKNFTSISVTLLIISVLFIVVIFLLVNSTLRIALFSQRFLIRSMQLVGAKKWFIQRPFLFRAAGYGFLGGAIASALLWILSNYAQQKIEDLKLVHQQDDFLLLITFLLVAGVLLAVVSTLVSIQKYLKMSLDELY